METSNILILLVALLFSVTKTFASCRPQDEPGFHIYFFGSNGSEFCEFTELGNIRKVQDILKNRHNYVNLGANYKMIIYGFHEHLNSDSVQTLLKAYKKRGQFIVFVLEWSIFNHEANQLLAISKARQIAPQISLFLNNELHNQNVINLRLFELVGISIGAHLAAFISRDIYEKSGHVLKVPQITGLDPAGRIYFDSDSLRVLDDHLNANDGEDFYEL